jgi:hypothetical protein
MSVFDKIKDMFGSETEVVSEPVKETKKRLTPKQKATKKGEPWFTIVDVEIDSENPRNGAFELDWNEPFVGMLRRHGLVGDSDEEIVDQWFQDLCRQIAMETYDEDVVGSNVNIQMRDIEGGKREYK